MHPAARMAMRVRPRHVVVGRVVFEIRMPTTRDLVANGYTTLVGVGEAKKALDEARDNEDALTETFDAGGDKAEVEKRRAEKFAERMRQQLEYVEELRTDPKRMLEYGQVMHAYVAAGVQRMGVLRGSGPDPDLEDGAESPPSPEWWGGETHRELMPDGWEPGAWVDLHLVSIYAKEPKTGPGETVTQAAERLARKGQLWVGSMDPVEVSTLFHAIRGIVGGRARRVAGFRWPTRPSSAA